MPTTFIQRPQSAAEFEWAQASGLGAVLRCAPLAPHAHHLFTSHDLELRGDEREWQALADVFGVRGSPIRLVQQVHRSDVAVARRGNAADWPIRK